METPPGQAGGRSDADGAAAPPPEVARELAEIRQQREVQLVRWQLRERCQALAAELEAAQRAVAAREASRGAAHAQHEEALAVLQRGYEEKLRATQSSRMLQQLSARMLAQAVAHESAQTAWAKERADMSSRVQEAEKRASQLEASTGGGVGQGMNILASRAASPRRREHRGLHLSRSPQAAQAAYGRPQADDASAATPTSPLRWSFLEALD
jgi:hypothetical protein